MRDGKRLDADVSAVGDPLTGFDIYDSYNCGTRMRIQRVEEGWATFGGTSLSAPMIAALYALAGGGDGVSTRRSRCTGTPPTPPRAST